MRKRIQMLLSLSCILFLQQTVVAQCQVDNVFFDAGESIQYDLYFKYGLIDKKAGKASLQISNATYAGAPAYKMSMISHTEGVARKLFSLSDTLSCYTSKSLQPLAFKKLAHEDGDYTIEDYTYKYLDNKVRIDTRRVKNGEEKFNESVSSANCSYDMLSVVYYARTLDYSNMKSGSKAKVYFMSGKKHMSMTIIHQGIETLKVNDGKKYECIKLSLQISDKAFENGKEAMKVYLTNDKNRMPLRIDSKLKVGSVKSILKSYKGNKHPVATK